MRAGRYELDTETGGYVLAEVVDGPPWRMTAGQMWLVPAAAAVRPVGPAVVSRAPAVPRAVVVAALPAVLPIPLGSQAIFP